MRRTLEDLGWEDRVVREALARRLIRPEDVPSELEAGPTRNDFQDRMRRLVVEAGLPLPVSEHPIGPYLADFAWPAYKLVVETDGWSTHGYRAAFERDRAKDAYFAACGWTVIRITWRQLSTEPLKVAARIAAALAHRQPAGPP